MAQSTVIYMKKGRTGMCGLWIIFFFFFWPEWTVDNLQATWKSIELVEEDVTN